MGALQPMHLIIVLVIVLLIFGPGKLPDLGRAIGDSMREFRRATAPSSASCGHCKALLEANSRFCGSCGTSIEAAPSPAPLV
jgi:TatA/E family protein of Tat protein translocase